MPTENKGDEYRAKGQGCYQRNVMRSTEPRESDQQARESTVRDWSFALQTAYQKNQCQRRVNGFGDELNPNGIPRYPANGVEHPGDNSGRAPYFQFTGE